MNRSRSIAIARQRAFTLVEVLVVLTVIAAVSVVILPTLQDDSQLRVRAAASILASDIEFAQVLSISQPNDPVLIRFKPEEERYWLAYADAPETPLIRQDTGEAYLVEFGVGRARTASGVSMWLLDVPSDEMAFDPNGGLVEFNTEPQIIIGLEGKYQTLSISALTGTVTETEGAPEGWSEKK